MVLDVDICGVEVGIVLFLAAGMRLTGTYSDILNSSKTSGSILVKSFLSISLLFHLEVMKHWRQTIEKRSELFGTYS